MYVEFCNYFLLKWNPFLKPLFIKFISPVLQSSFLHTPQCSHSLVGVGLVPIFLHLWTVLLQIFLLMYILRRGNKCKLYRECKFMRRCQLVFQSGGTNVHSSQQYIKGILTHILTNRTERILFSNWVGEDTISLWY